MLNDDNQVDVVDLAGKYVNLINIKDDENFANLESKSFKLTK